MPDDPLFNVVEVMYSSGIALALTIHIRMIDVVVLSQM
jgi:hypothetical protein